ncbi:MAG: very short patch repair endonuclease [Prevotella sp.]|nr:very short patch repair endonuclease [Prevotella sp.]
MDILSAEQRRRCMGSVRSRDTGPELVVRRYLFAHGFRYRLHARRLPGSPDIVLKKYRAVVFVNGCFWHGHEACRYAALPATHAAFWAEKIRGNRERDRRVDLELSALGWRVLTVWTCGLKRGEKERTLEALAQTIRNDNK